jgi:hypothetical protein
MSPESGPKARNDLAAVTCGYSYELGITAAAVTSEPETARLHIAKQGLT